MKFIKIRELEGNWNEKFYGKDKNEIYLNEEKIVLTEEEAQDVIKQCSSSSQETLAYKNRNRKEAQIMEYIKELAKITEDKDELKGRFQEILNCMKNV